METLGTLPVSWFSVSYREGTKNAKDATKDFLGPS